MLWHLITGEYPPQPGGVADHTRLLAHALARSGDTVHVWAPALTIQMSAGPEEALERGVTVHRLSDHFGLRGLRQLDRRLREFGSEREDARVLVQYVPHMYGWRAMNIPFAAWLGYRAPRYRVLFHEVAFPVRRGQPFKHNVLGQATRRMAALAARRADVIYISTPLWREVLRDCGVERETVWLPVPSNLPTEVDAIAVRRVRETIGDGTLIGHFGTFHEKIAEFLLDVLPRLLRSTDRRLLLMGYGSDRFAGSLLARCAELAGRVVSRDGLAERHVAEHLAACDIVLQPYLDGVSSRRGSAMAALALGRPIVTNFGAATESIWSDERLVELVPYDQREVFAERVEQLLAAPAEARKLGERGRRGYAAHFSCEKTVETLRST